MDRSEQSEAAYPTAGASRTIVLAFIILFWSAQYSILTLQRYFVVGGLMTNLLLPRLLVTLVAMLYSFAAAELLRRLSLYALAARLAAGLAAAILGCIVHAVFNFAIFDLMVPDVAALKMTAQDYAPPLLQWFWSYFALVGTLLAITHSLALRDQAEHVSILQRASHSAQLRSLRLQLNPHFMFNTLNSIAALIGTSRLPEAEAMLENLSDFLRSSLETAPEESVTLEREIALQRHYLDVEAIRFADRLSLVYAIEPEAREALVPALITQPVVENAIHHAVSRSLGRVVLTIAARRDGEWLRLTIHNSPARRGRAAMLRARPGTGLGLRNVALRLRGYYCDRFEFSAGPAADNGFEVRFALPFARAPGPC